MDIGDIRYKPWETRSKESGEVKEGKDVKKSRGQESKEEEEVKKVKVPKFQKNKVEEKARGVDTVDSGGGNRKDILNTFTPISKYYMLYIRYVTYVTYISYLGLYLMLSTI